MIQRTRRDFLKDVGTGVVVASVGPSLAADLGFSPAFADEGPERLTFGQMEPLVSLMQETPAARLLPLVVERLRGGTELRTIVAAAALANARTFGGEDYVGFHTMMAIAPAFHMSGELSEARRALPVLKVLFRNASRIQEYGGPPREVLHPVQAARLPADRPGGEVLREKVRGANANDAERTYAALASTADDALNNVLFAVQDACEVHRVVLPYRAWDLMGIIGREQAHTLLRQSVRYCVKAETERYTQSLGSVRTLVPRLLDQHRLLGRELGSRTGDDRWLEELSQTIFGGTPPDAAGAAAAALAEGYAPAAVAEAISLAANQLILRDNGRPRDEAPNKPAGSVHGDSIGVHACDSANAWRNLSRAANARNKVVCLILGAWQVAHDRAGRGGTFLTWQPYPRADAREEVRKLQPDRLLPALEEAIRNRNQAIAAALAERYAGSNLPARPLWDMFLRYAISEDGALHAEKFYRTTTEEFAAARPAFRPRYVAALARVTASAHGYAAPGHAEACRLLGV
ncbi:MAG TPA: twin-arginine translocation signal domain-containing protein [Gemmataceae bacterium]|nr:twin-arginine translocation signal domain-containing protein [Gemmataceae bacterium]